MSPRARTRTRTIRLTRAARRTGSDGALITSLIALMVAASTLVTGLLLSGTAQAQTPIPLVPEPITSQVECRDVTLIGLRGSGQTGGSTPAMFGTHLAQIANDYAAAVKPSGLTVGFHGIAYPAVPAYNLEAALASARVGAQQAIVDMKALLRICPNTSFVLIGYSQGAAAAHLAMDALVGTGNLHQGVLDHTVASVLVSDPFRRLDDAAPYYLDIFGAAPGNGIKSTVTGPLASLYDGEVLSVCTAGDVICSSVSNSIDMTVHATAYLKPEARQPIVDWMRTNIRPLGR